MARFDLNVGFLFPFGGCLVEWLILYGVRRFRTLFWMIARRQLDWTDVSKTGVDQPVRQMTLEVNGRAQALPIGATIGDLIAVLNLGDQRCAVEVNTVLVRRDRHATHVLKAGDRVEVVTLVGGG